MFIRYSRWDGTQEVDPFTAEDLMERIADDVLRGSDLSRAIRRMLQRGADFSSGRRMMGLQEMLERLRDRRTQNMDRFNLGSIFDEIKERLDEVVDTERRSIRHRLGDEDDEGDAPSGAEPSEAQPGAPGQDQQARSAQSGQQPAGAQAGRQSSSSQSGESGQSGQQSAAPGSSDPMFRELLENLARRHLEQLDHLPPDVGGRIKELRDYDFMDPEARQKFEELLQMLQQQVMQSYFKGLQQGLQSMTPEAMQQIQQMVQDLNELLQKRQRGEDTETDFKEFMQKWGQFFPEDIQNLDQLIEHIQQQMAQMESLLNSMTPEMRRELEDMMEGLFRDNRLQWELAKLGANLERINPTGGQAGDFEFGGDEPLTLQEAMKLMGDMNSLDGLERELMEAAKYNDASKVDADDVSRLLGEEAGRMMEQMQEITRMLEEAGLIQKRGNEWQLTPRAARKIGERALREVFGELKQSTLGDHGMDQNGIGVERLDDTRPYTYGDPFQVDAQKTIMNALRREGTGLPVRIRSEDFEIYRTEDITQCSTVIMLDMSYSMMMSGCFQEGRKVALALDSLIRSQFPRDNLDVVAFSYFVLTLKPQMLLDSYWVEYGGGTNFQEALRQARMLLNKYKGGTKQIIMITDGEPTTYSYWSGGGEGWNGSRRYGGVAEETLREVVRCARDNITVNTFMMEQDPSLSRFVQLMAKANRGRAFFAAPGKLGEYVLVDYLNNKRRVVR